MYKHCNTSPSNAISNAILNAISSPCILDDNVVSVCNHPCVRHCYNFECDLVDSSSTGNVDGIAHGNIQIGFNGVTNLGKYVALDGTDEKQITINSVNVNALGFAISLWFRTDNFGQDARLFSKAINNFIQGHIVSCQLSNNKLKFRLKLGNDIDNGTTQWQTIGDPINSNIWYHVVYWYDGCDVRIYLNGVKQDIEETQNGNTNNTSRAFNSFKGCPVYQGNEETAIGSQPVDPIQTFSGWRAYDGCMDQLVIWNFAISGKLINELYNSGDGSNTISINQHSQCITFGSSNNHLLTFSHVLCIKTCFKSTLCKILNGCNSITLKLVDSNNNETKLIIIDNNSLNEWPGAIEILDSKNIGGMFCYTIRLQLCIKKLYNCPRQLCCNSPRQLCCNRVQRPIDINDYNDCDDCKVILSVGDENFIEKPLNSFVITGFKY